MLLDMLLMNMPMPAAHQTEAGDEVYAFKAAALNNSTWSRKLRDWSDTRAVVFEAGSAGCSGLRCRGVVGTQNHGGYRIPCVACLISPMIRVFCFGFRSGYRAFIVREPRV